MLASLKPKAMHGIYGSRQCATQATDRQKGCDHLHSLHHEEATANNPPRCSVLQAGESSESRKKTTPTYKELLFNVFSSGSVVLFFGVCNALGRRCLQLVTVVQPLNHKYSLLLQAGSRPDCVILTPLACFHRGVRVLEGPHWIPHSSADALHQPHIGAG